MGLPLHAACERGDTERVRQLLGDGALIDEKGWRRRTALMYASRHGYTEVVQLSVRERSWFILPSPKPAKRRANGTPLARVPAAARSQCRGLSRLQHAPYHQACGPFTPPHGGAHCEGALAPGQRSARGRGAIGQKRRLVNGGR